MAASRPRLPAWLTFDRKLSLLLGTGGAAAAALAVFALHALIGPQPPRTAQLAVPGAAALAVFAMTLAVSVGRLVTRTWNPLAHAPGRYLRTAERALTNTVEQGLVFALAGGAAALQADAQTAGWLAALAAVFLLARAAFFAGYLAGPFARAPGMSATFAVNLAALILLVRALV